MKFKKAAVAVAGVMLTAGAAAPAMADASAWGYASHSPGFLSGNVVQVPVDVPVNVCGNSVDILALLNPALGSECTGK